MTKYKFRPRDADGWDLYKNMRGSETAAKRLNAAMVQALKCETKADAWIVMGAAMDIDARFGARDTERRWIVEYELSQVFTQGGST